MLPRLAIPAAFCALMLAARPALAADPGFIGLQVAPDENGKGVLVKDVLGDGPADKAGLKADDVITEIDGAPPKDVKAFVDAVAAHKPGDEIALKVLRKGKEESLKVKVGKRPTETPPPPAGDQGFIGLAVRPGADGKGVEVMGVLEDSPAEKAGLKKGDVVTELDGAAVTDLKALESKVAAHKVGDEITLKVLRDGKEQQIKVKVGKRPEEK